jgi:hypothetical protein
MQAEIIALRHQVTVLQRTQKPKRLEISLVLDLEGSSRQTRTSGRSEGHPGFDSSDEPREPDLGRSSDSQRTHEVGH